MRTGMEYVCTADEGVVYESTGMSIVLLWYIVELCRSMAIHTRYIVPFVHSTMYKVHLVRGTYYTHVLYMY